MNFVAIILFLILLLGGGSLVGGALASRNYGWAVLGIAMAIVGVAFTMMYGKHVRNEFEEKRDILVTECKSKSFAVYEDSKYVGCIIDADEDNRSLTITWDRSNP